MFRRTVRIACLLVGLMATAGLSYRVFQDEDTLTRERQTAAVAGDAASQTAELLLDLRASLYAYVAPGQGLPFWSKRAQDSIGSVQVKLQSLDDMLGRSGGSMQASLDAVDQVVAAEQ